MNYELYMAEALAEARAAAAGGAPPAAAIAVADGAMVARAQHRVARSGDPTAHAVVAVLRDAARRLRTTQLADVTVFTVVEPCAMCVGALLASDAAALVYALPNPATGAAGGGAGAALEPPGGRRLAVVSGIRRDEAAELYADRDPAEGA